MYQPEVEKKKELRKRGFKFINKNGKTQNRSLATKTETNGSAPRELNELEKEDFQWPKELMAIMN